MANVPVSETAAANAADALSRLVGAAVGSAVATAILISLTEIVAGPANRRQPPSSSSTLSARRLQWVRPGSPASSLAASAMSPARVPTARPAPALATGGSRTSVLRAAMSRFAATPYSEVTIRIIAADAGVGAPLVMKYFGTKDKLFLAAERIRRRNAPSLARRTGTAEAHRRGVSWTACRQLFWR
jgi:hypothetical protein